MGFIAGGKMIDQAVAQGGLPDRYPVRCRGCSQRSTPVLLWSSSGEVRKVWDGVHKARVDLRQPRSSSGQCESCGSIDLAIGNAEIA